jgi:CheY-like chemotaxis protein
MALKESSIGAIPRRIGAPIPVERARIFVAEDDSSIADLMRELLEGEGYAVALLRQPGNAYEEIAERLPDLVILDITLGAQGDGWRALATLRGTPETARLPAIVCSADIRGLRARAADIRALGCRLIEMPFEIDALLTTIHESLARARPARKHYAKPNQLDRVAPVRDSVSA